ncbi:A/G-specific adenine glycosylase [Robinsoniella sp. KNHs210]|uniref:A/G-specific adenine glycosylase n=1 Tax=Robinsoniella sp. KNHs210 TaxID=1469950 RepID=UPI0009DD7284|nr:A/G-specific adenine glycosylase [Robinsoniella sp. KNHs210]
MLNEIVEPLLMWFRANARVLPWREDKAAYRIWVSEIMLQQTRVEAVKPFFERFTKALPDVHALAVCEEDKLLKFWEGLGYYNRVRNMQIAAKTIVEEFDGQLPADYEALLSLKGIGNYTAGAVASIAYNIPVPAVDGNVLRVISRVLASEEDIMKQSVRKKMEEDIKAIMPKDCPGDFNQALMELGATVCVPNGMAKCDICPLASICKAKALDIVMELPKKTKQKPRRIEEKTVLVIKDGDKAAIRKRPKKGLLAGLYELPNLEGHLTADEVLEYIKERQLAPIRIRQLRESKHIFSHVEWRMTGYVIQVEELENAKDTGMLFVEPWKTQEEYPIPAAFGAYADYLQIKLGQEKYEV